jgi:P27 family predicted phage terminase small subunit
MGARGAKAKPAALKRLEGNPGKRKLPTGHVVPTGPTRSPEHLEGYALEVWQRVMRAMPDGVYLSTDVETLLAYCDAADTLRKAMWAIKIEGHVLQTPYGPKRNPWTVIASQARQQIATLGTRLGLDPVARESIKAPEQQKPDGKFTGLVGIDGGKA